jgi:hypothetical protein
MYIFSACDIEIPNKRSVSLKTVCNRLSGNTHETAKLDTCVTSHSVNIGIVRVGCIYYVTVYVDRIYIIVPTGFVPIKNIEYFNCCKLRIHCVIYLV